jgi:hypothetical protein
MHFFSLLPRKTYFIIALFLYGSSLNAFAQGSEPSDSLKNVIVGKEAEMFRVVLTGDRAAAEKMIGEDYMTINADGVMQNKPDMMKTFGGFKGATVTLFDKRIRTYGNLAIITGGAKFYIKSILAAKIFYTETWIYRDGHWFFIGWQGTLTGLPSYYPIIFTALGFIVLYILVRLILKRIRKHKLNTA